MSTPRRVPDDHSGIAWLIDRATSLLVGVAGQAGLGQGEYRRFAPMHLVPRLISAATTVTPLDDGAHWIASGNPTITLVGGLHGAFRLEITGACTIALQPGLTASLDQRVVQAGLQPWAQIVVLAVDATGIATQFAIRGQKQS